MKNLIKRLIGADKIEDELLDLANQLKKEKEKIAIAKKNVTEKEKRVDKERLKLLEKIDPKEAATEKGEAYVAVIDTQVNPENIRNGFFELDWNNEFIEQLIDAGYSGETTEEIVEGWFRTIIIQMLEDDDDLNLSTDREIGHIKIVPRDDGKSEVS